MNFRKLLKEARRRARQGALQSRFQGTKPLLFVIVMVSQLLAKVLRRKARGQRHLPHRHAPNHALISAYGVGDGIMQHEDAPSYYPLVAIASTGADASVTFSPQHKHADDASLRAIRIAVQRRRVLLFKANMSLTIHHVTPTASATP